MIFMEKKVHVKKELSRSLKLRKKLKKKKPNFKRQESYKKHLKKVWRKPKGIDSKLKKGKRGRGRTVRPGFSSPIAVRGLTWTGHKIVRVFNPADIDKIDHSKQVALIASGVGAKKRVEILKKAEEKNIHVLNR